MDKGVEFSKHRIRKWSISVRWRDRKCQVCGSKEKLEAHHIFDKSTYPELAYDINNGTTLCGAKTKTGHACHRAFHISYKGGTNVSCNRKDLRRFKALVRWAQGMRNNNNNKEIK